MTNPMAMLRSIHNDKGPLWDEVRTWCPACEISHPFRIKVHQPEEKRSDGQPWPTWDWDGNLESPTFSPSMLAGSSVHLCKNGHTYTYCDREFEECGHHGHGYVWVSPEGEQRQFKVYETVPEGWVRHTFGPDSSPHPRDPAYGNCHSFLKAGVWDFLTDSGHSLAGQKVPMMPMPDHFFGDAE